MPVRSLAAKERDTLFVSEQTTLGISLISKMIKLVIIIPSVEELFWYKGNGGQVVLVEESLIIIWASHDTR